MLAVRILINSKKRFSQHCLLHDDVDVLSLYVVSFRISVVFYAKR